MATEIKWSVYLSQFGTYAMTVVGGTMTKAEAKAKMKRLNAELARRTADDQPEITSGLGIGGAGSDDYNISTEGDRGGSDYHRDSHKPGEYVYPAGTTQGIRGDDNDRCHCGRPGDWNSGAGQYLCSRHWDEY